MTTTNVQNITILGATGSIGASTLELMRLHADKYRLFAVSGYTNTQKLQQICVEFCPQYAVIGEQGAAQLTRFCQDLALPTKVLVAQDGLDFVAAHSNTDVVVAAIVGAAGLSSTLAAAQAGKKILLANKESLVMAGDLLMQSAQKSGAVILPIDSEHSAIFQCLPQEVQRNRTLTYDSRLGIKQLWLTASGGAFLHKSYTDMQNASAQDATKHPNWSMGKKISVDSNTMMNKGLELIEACYLFGVQAKDIKVVIHPQSIVHSLVEYTDGSFVAQLGTPDMKTPIAYALSYPNRMTSGAQALDLFALQDLQFIAPDEQKFACLALAKKAMALGNGACIILNASNEVAVWAFLQGKIRLTDIADIVARSLAATEFCDILCQSLSSLADILALDKKARAFAHTLLPLDCID